MHIWHSALKSVCGWVRCCWVSINYKVRQNSVFKISTQQSQGQHQVCNVCVCCACKTLATRSGPAAQLMSCVACKTHLEALLWSELTKLVRPGWNRHADAKCTAPNGADTTHTLLARTPSLFWSTLTRLASMDGKHTPSLRV